MFRPNNFYSVLTPIYYTIKLFGLAPFNVNRNRFKSSKINIMWSLMVMMFLNSYTSLGLSRRPEYSEQFISKVVDVASAYLTQLSMFCGILFGCIFRNKVLNAIDDINLFDRKTNKNLSINLTKEYRKSKIYITILLLVAIICTGTAAAFAAIDGTNLLTLKLSGEFLAYVAPETISSFVEFEFCALVLCLKQRFGWLNKKILNITNSLEKKLCEYDNLFSIHIKKKRFRPATHLVSTGFIQDRALNIIENLRLRHHNLCTISRNLNQAFSVQILFVIIQTFITIIVLFYYAGIHIREDHQLPQSYILHCFAQITLALLQVVILVKVCSSTALEARETAILIHNTVSLKLKNKCKEDLQYAIASFSLQLLHQNVEFKACDIFVINETLLFTFFGTITAYLVIVIQFELSEDVRNVSET